MSTNSQAENDDGLPLVIKLLMLVAALVLAYVLLVDVIGFLDILGAVGV